MPPIKTFIFNHLTKNGVQIIINTYSFLQAYETLVELTKHPADYKFKQ